MSKVFVVNGRATAISSMATFVITTTIMKSIEE